MTDRLSLGTVQFGLDYGINNRRGRVPEAEVCQILRMAAAARIDLLDTAAAYGSAQRLIGDCLDNGQHAFKIVSKIAPSATEPAQVAASFGCTRSELRTGSIYGLLVHDFACFIGNPENWDVLRELRASGQVEKIGYSLYYPSQLAWLMEHDIDFDIIQVPYNVLDQRFAALLPALRTRGVEVHVRSVFLQGLFFVPVDQLSPYYEAVAPKIKAINALAESNNIPLSSLLLGFALNNDAVARAIVGVTDVDELCDCIRALEYLDVARTLESELNALQHHDERVLLPFNWPSA